MTRKTPKTGKKSYANQRRSAAMKARWAARRLSTKPAVTAASEKANVAGHLSTGEIHDIIEACHAKGVLSFQYGPLQLLFKKTIDEPKTGNVQQTAGDTIEGASRLPRGERLQEASDLATEELEHLKITDPAAYEEFIQSEDAEDGRT